VTQDSGRDHCSSEASTYLWKQRTKSKTVNIRISVPREANAAAATIVLRSNRPKYQHDCNQT